MKNIKIKTKKSRSRKMRGNGDYSDSVTAIKEYPDRLEAKIDHLERSINKATPKINQAASSIGRTLGNFVNQGDLGAMAGEQLARFFGHGDYVVKSNSLMQAIHPNQNSPNPLKFEKNGRGTRIVEREFLFDLSSGPVVSGSSSFLNTVLPINPTNRTTFPWLSTLANQFDQWEPNGIIFEFVSTSSTFNGASQALGTVIMATDYDVFDAAYPTKQYMENSDYACSTRPSENLLHGIECAKSERPTPILYTSVTSSANLSNLGNFQIASVGCSTAGVKLGEVWVSYDITFYKKQLADTVLLLSGFEATGTVMAGDPLISTTSVVSLQRGITWINLGPFTRFSLPPTQASGRFMLYTYYTVLGPGDVLTPSAVSNCVVTSSRSSYLQLSNPYVNLHTIDITNVGATFDLPGKTALTSTFVFACVEVNPVFLV